MSGLIHTTKKLARYAAHCADMPLCEARTLNWYLHPESMPPTIPKIQDRVTLYALLSGDYRTDCELCAMRGEAEASFSLMYLSAAAAVRANQLWRKKEPVQNPAVKYNLEHGRGNLEAICGLIAVNEWEEAAAFAKLSEPIYYALLTGDDALAGKLAAMLPDSPPAEAVRREVYFTGVIFCKAIFTAMLTGDAPALQAALEARVRQYRALPWDYSTVIDRVSVACIKIAQRRGLSVSLDIAELPSIFLDAARRIDKTKTKLPEVDAS